MAHTASLALADLDFGEAETGGSLKSTYSLATARFSYAGRSCIALEWFHRTGHPFKPYASLILIAEECDKTADEQMLRSIALGTGERQAGDEPQIAQSPTLGRKVIILDDPSDRNRDLGPFLEAIL